MIGWMMSLQSVYGRDLGAGGALLAQATRATPLSESVLGPRTESLRGLMGSLQGPGDASMLQFSSPMRVEWSSEVAALQRRDDRSQVVGLPSKARASKPLDAFLTARAPGAGWGW